MAIGDTVQAGLMRVDSSPIQVAGAAQARANQAFGNALGQAAEGYFIGKEKKERAKEIEEELIRQGANPDSAKAISKNPFLQKEHARREEAEQRMKIAKMQNRPRGASASELLASKKYDEGKERDKENEAIENQFINTLTSRKPTGELNEAGKQEVENFKAFASPEDPRINPFIESTLKNPEFQQTESVMEMTGKRFIEQFESPETRKLALNFMQSRQKDAPSMSRLVTIQDGKGGFEQVGLNSAGDPIRSYGPPKPSGMFATPEQQADARARTLSVDNANDFVNDQRDIALESAKSIVPATRALTLLEKGDLETGGITEFKTNVTAMLDSLGIPIPKETMDKVSNTQTFRAEVGDFLFQNIGKTKGTISDNEMRIFTSISPGLQMTPEANKVLLKYIIKKAEREKDKVKFIQKMRRDGVSITEQRNKLEDFILDNDLSEILSPIVGEPSELQTFRIGQKQVEGEVVGKKPDGSLIVKTKDGQFFIKPAQ